MKKILLSLSSFILFFVATNNNAISSYFSLPEIPHETLKKAIREVKEKPLLPKEEKEFGKSKSHPIFPQEENPIIKEKERLEEKLKKGRTLNPAEKATAKELGVPPEPRDEGR